jgi:2-hydroxy-3-oxopropionate reductase
MGTELGFIGLGVMGGHMARHLSEHYDLRVFDIDADKMAAVDKARAAQTVQKAAQGAGVVLLSLPNTEIVKEVILGTQGIARVMGKGTTVIDTSTTEPVASREIAATLKAQGIDFMDAPVSGGEKGAREASLSVMAGADEAVFERCKCYLEVVGTSIVRVGDIGAGGVAKLVNNMIVGATFSVIAEGFALGRANGLDPEVLYDAIKGGWAGSTVMSVAGPNMIERNFAPGGTIDLLFKDLGYALSLARNGNVPVPMTAMADEVFKAARASGRGGYAQPIIIELWEKLLGLDH